MKAKTILLFALILGIAQGAICQENDEEKSKATGFFGVIASGNDSYEFGGGFEVGFLPKKVGFGIQAEYSPAPEPNTESGTFLRGFFLFKVAGPFYIKVPGGIEARNLDFRGEFQNEVSPTFGIGTQFVFEKAYFGVQFNVSKYQVKGLDFSRLSVVMGFKFK